MNYLFYGKDSGRIEKEINKIILEYKNDCDVIQYDLNMKTMNDVLIELSTIPFFCSHKIVIVKHCDFLGSGAINFDASSLENYLENPLLENVLIMTADFEKYDARKKIVKLVNQTCRVKVFNQLDEKDKRTYIISKCKEMKIELNVKSMNILVDRLPIDTMQIDKQLEKLACFPDLVDEKVIEALILRPLEDDIFMLCESIISRKFEKAYHLYQDMISLSYDPIYLIAVISSQFRFYYQVKVCLNKMMDESQIASYLKAHPYRIKL
ncbi:MAG: DNA polymerase III subunit delta, partial [Traorella sp.]